MLTKEQLYVQCTMPEWAMKHLWSIHHINARINKDKLFEEIDKGMDFNDFRKTSVLRKRLNDNKDRIRMFACVYQIMITGAVFYVKERKLPETNIRIDYIKSKTICAKGVHLGMRFEEGVYVPLTLLVDRAVNPAKTTEGLQKINVRKLEIIEDGKTIEKVEYNCDHP